MTTPTTVQARFQLRADTAANWASVNPTLLNNEFGLETDTKKLKVGNGSTAWNSLAYFPSIVTGGTVLGNLEIGTTGTLTFEGSTADGFETTLGVVNPTADRTINLPNQSGTVIVSGNASIVNADISATAEIAVSKLADGAARQVLQTDSAGTGVEWTDSLDLPGTLDVTQAATFDNNVTIQGDLTVNGTTTTIDTQNLIVEDKNVIIGNVTSPTDVTADGGGITLKGTTDKTISWSDTTNAWTSSEVVDIPAGTAGAPSLIFGGDVNTGLYSPGADQVAISTAGTGRLFVDSTGRVGINTSSPTQALHVYDGAFQAQAGTGNTNTDISLIRAVAGPTGGAVFNIRAADGANDNSDWLITTNANESLRFDVGGSERLRIDPSGRLLVGTSSWSSDHGLIVARSGSSNSYGRVFVGKLDSTITSADDVGAIDFGSSSDGSLGASIFAHADLTWTHGTSHPTRLVVSTTADGASTPTERLRITSSGKIGLGTTAPAATAHISGNTIVSKVDLANASYDSVSFSVATQETSPVGVFFSPDGRKMFVNGNSSDNVNEYTLSTPWVVSSATYVTAFGTGTQDTSPQGIFFRSDGLKMYVLGTTGDSVYQYALTTPWSLATASYESKSFSVTTQETGPTGVFFKPNGLAMYVVGSAGDAVQQYTLSTAWDVSTATFTQSFSIASQETNGQDLSFTRDGANMFVLGAAVDDVTIYTLTTPWDISTAAHVTQFSVSTQETSPTGLYVKPDGTKFYIVGTGNDTVYQYTIPSAEIDLTGTTNINGDATIAQDLTVRGGIAGSEIKLLTTNADLTRTERLRITNDGVQVYNQPSPAAVDTTATLTVANLKTGIITSTTAAAVTMTLPTGTLTEGGFGHVYTNMTFEWTVINTGATNAVTVQAGTDHTLVGSGTVAASNSGRFATRRTAANTWVTYRLSS